MLWRADKRFPIHVNDKHRIRDWRLIPGAVDFWDLVERMAHLEHFGCDAYFTADVFRSRLDRQRAFEAGLRMMLRAQRLAQRVEIDRLEQFRLRRDVAGILDSVLDPRGP